MMEVGPASVAGVAWLVGAGFLCYLLRKQSTPAKNQPAKDLKAEQAPRLQSLRLRGAGSDDGAKADPAVAAAAAKTFLPQKSLIPIWKDGFETWHIFVFLVGLIGGNIYLLRV
jgi:hypothetical protein